MDVSLRVEKTNHGFALVPQVSQGLCRFCSNLLAVRRDRPPTDITTHS